MLLELTALPPAIVQYINAGQKVEIELIDGKAQVTATTAPIHQRTPGRLANLLGDLNLKFDEQELLAPLDEEEMKWWNGDYTDEFGMSLPKEKLEQNNG